jgi:hypothetical protein
MSCPLSEISTVTLPGGSDLGSAQCTTQDDKEEVEVEERTVSGDDGYIFPPNAQCGENSRDACMLEE